MSDIWQHCTVHKGRLYLCTDTVIRFYEFKDKTWGDIPMANSISTEYVDLILLKSFLN